MEDKKNSENNNLKEAKELKEIVNHSSNELIENLSNIFSATKFDMKNIKTGNIDINKNMDSIANEINTLLNVINKLKIKELKKEKVEPEKNKIQFEKDREKEKEREKNRNVFLQKAIDTYQNINNYLTDLKKTDFYIMSKKICGE
jgi:hypothetical protein